MLKKLVTALARKDNRTSRSSAPNTHKKRQRSSVSARNLFKETTQFPQESNPHETNLPDAAELMLKEKLRLPMYLQLAGYNDEAWKILNQLSVEYTDAFSQAEITAQMREFLNREKKFSSPLFATMSQR